MLISAGAEAAATTTAAVPLDSDCFISAGGCLTEALQRETERNNQQADKKFPLGFTQRQVCQ